MELELTTMAVANIKPNPRNARTHKARQVGQIEHSITSFGFTNPLLVDEQGMLIAGHGRLAAAINLKMPEVPVIVLTGLSAKKKAALALADNRIALNAGWDLEILADELRELSTPELEFDLEALGFEIGEIDVLLDGTEPADSRENELPPIESIPVTQSGDVWCLGRHRLLCGDALNPSDLATVMASETARVMFADPPFNVKIDGHVCGSGSIKHREFAMASGEMSSQQFAAFLTSAFKNAAAVSCDGAIHFICIDWRHLSELLEAGRTVYSELKNLCVWVKDNGGMGSFHRSQHELILVWKVGRGKHLNTVELGRSGRYRTNVWSYPGVNTMRAGRLEELAMHPTVKPVALIADAIKDCSRRGEIVLDPFAGSGTTIIAAEKTGRRACAIEIDPTYVDVAVRRWERHTSQHAVHQATGQTFDVICEARKSGGAVAEGTADRSPK